MKSTFRRTVFCLGIAACALLFTAGRQALLGAVQDLPSGVDSLYARALASGEEGSVLRAIRMLERMARDDAEPAWIYVRIGRLYLKLRKSDRAVQAFQRAVRADGRLAGAHAGLGLAFLDLKGDWRGAILHLQAALALDSTNVEVQYHLARAYAEGSQEEKARKAADRAIRMDPDYAPPYLLLARLYEKENSDDIALLYYRNYLQHHPQDQDAVYRFARRLAETGREAEAERLLGRLDDPRGYAVLAQILMQQGNYEDALRAFEEYISSLPDGEQALYHDISIVARPREAAAYRATPPERRRDYLRRFWLDRDPLLASGGLMRWTEHYRRVLYARENYGKKHYPWDRRGEVYIRYGEPDYRSTSREVNTRVPQGVQIIQTELARRLYGPDAVSHTFVGPVYPVRTDRFINVIPEDSPDMDDIPRMPGESMLSRAGMAAEDTLGFYGYKPVTIGLAGMTVPWEVWVYTKVGGGIEVVFTDEIGKGRFDYAPVPTLTSDDRKRLDAAGPGEFLRVQQLFSNYAPEMVMRKVVRETPEVYDWGELEALDFHFDVVDSRGSNGQTDVRVFTGIPVRDLAVPGAGDTAVVDRRVALIDRRSRQVYRVYGDITVPLTRAGGGVIVEEFPMAVPPGDYVLAVQVWRKGTKRMGVYHLPTPVESYAGEALMLSDIQVAREVAPADSAQSGQFVRRGFRVMPSPGRVFYRGHHVFLYFEIYNLTRDRFGQTRYQVAYTVRDANQSPLFVRALSGLGRLLSGGAREGAVTVRYEQSGLRDWEGDYVELDIGETGPGEYEVRVTVVDINSGAEVSKTARFHIVEAGASAAGP